MKVKKFKFNLKELYYFGVDFLIFFFIRPTDPTFRVEGDGKRNILLGLPYTKKKGGGGAGSDSKHGAYSRQGMLVWLLTYSVNKVAAIPKISFGS